MASLPYMQLYVADYLADTYHLTTEEHGAYMLMLMNYWQTGKALRYDRIPSVVRMDKNRFKEIENNLSDFFTIQDDLWIHERIEDDLKSVLNKSKKASESAKKRWEKKTSNANAEQTESHKDKIRQDKIRKDKNIDSDSYAVTTGSKTFIDSREIANYLYKKIIEVNPTFKEPNIKLWATDIDKAIRLDKRSKTQLLQCIDWIYSADGEFWQRNILSGKKLRDKFDAMNMQAINSKGNKNINVAKSWLAESNIDEMQAVLNVK